MGLKELKQQLIKQDQKQLINLLSELYKNVPAAKDYLDIYTSGDINFLIEKHKTEIEKYIYPRGRNMVTNEKEARKMIRTLQKMKIPELTIELNLHYVHCCITMIEDFGYSDESYEIALEKLFYQTVELIDREGMSSRYEDLISDLIHRGRTFGILEEY
ncbi:hypothetical protein [Aquimarina sp. I32.4]|uniref:hypothetical protein n=1 Tax=Aquimarina sp. I32.4 TaxID=2053903 RepID=UPI000CDE98B6|nr:hypothetical protein [Aquimarina sp. I32.4]